jgi:hypothetical protein
MKALTSNAISLVLLVFVLSITSVAQQEKIQLTQSFNLTDETILTTDINTMPEEPKRRLRLKNKLVLKSDCGLYVIEVLNKETYNNFEKQYLRELSEQDWTDTKTGKKYHNVFAVKNYCTFPSDIKEGSLFYFKLTTNDIDNCENCPEATSVTLKSKGVTISEIITAA